MGSTGIEGEGRVSLICPLPARPGCWKHRGPGFVPMPEQGGRSREVSAVGEYCPDVR